jgi:hypothetical protein
MRTSTAAIAVLILAGCAGDPVAEQARTKRQLDELYRPLLALVVESRESVQGFMKELGRNYVHPLQGDEEAKWIRKIEADLLPRNDRMCALIRAKRDLVDGDLPDSWAALLDHQDGWRADHDQWKKDGKAYGFRARTPFPRALESTLKKEVARLEALLK